MRAEEEEGRDEVREGLGVRDGREAHEPEGREPLVCQSNSPQPFLSLSFSCSPPCNSPPVSVSSCRAYG
jgi:hypothetical protein